MTSSPSCLIRLAAAAVQGGGRCLEHVRCQGPGAAAAAAARQAVWSAAIGNRQLPWQLCGLASGGQQLQLVLQQYSTGSSSSSNGSSQGSASPERSSGAGQQQQQQLGVQNATAAEAATASLASPQQQQQQQLGAALNFDEEPGQLPAAAIAASASHRAASSAAAANAAATAEPPQQQQQQQDAAAADKPLVIPPDITLHDVMSGGKGLNQILGLTCIQNPGSSPLKPFQLDPQPTLRDLDDQERLVIQFKRGFRYSDEAFTAFLSLLTKFLKSPKLREKARADRIPMSLVPQASSSFKRYMHRAVTPGLLATLLVAAAQPGGSGGSSSEAFPIYNSHVEGMLMPLFLEHCNEYYKQEIASYASAVATLDLRSPQTWYPYARAIKRKIIYHGGPTNSGKTYNALQALAAAQRGVYCAPLRLLAMEVYETLNHRGVYCDLVTGQEVMRVPGSQHVSCTVEMANINSHFDVAVVDEIQLIGDQQRGFAWSRALLGLPANTIHVCGDMSAVGLVRHLAGLCGDEFEIHTYERMTPLKLDPEGLPNTWGDVAPGDAVVAFSRRDIYKARRAIEAATGHKTCIVYGALPAETRRHQARLFNNPKSGVNILIASDAIGLGLNFNIRRVIFTTLSKRSRGGQGLVRVPVSLVKQIAGRAGRRNSIYPEGVATTLDKQDLPYLRKALEAHPSSLFTPAAGLAPEYDTVELLAAQFPDLSLEELLRKLDSESRLDGRFFLCKQEQLLEAARVLRWVTGLSLQDQFTLLNAPIDVYDDIQRSAFIDFARTYAAGQPVLFNEALIPDGPPKTELHMEQAENLHKIMGCWLWLSYRFEEGTFPGRERVQALARQLCDWLNTGLANIQTTEELIMQQAAAQVANTAGGSRDSSSGRSSGSTQAAASPANAAATAAAAQAVAAGDSEHQPAAGAAAAAAEPVTTAPPEAAVIAAAAAGADSSDADEYSDAAFTVYINEAPLAAADRGYDGDLLPAAAAAAGAGFGGGGALFKAVAKLQSMQGEADAAGGAAAGVATPVSSATSSSTSVDTHPGSSPSASSSSSSASSSPGPSPSSSSSNGSAAGEFQLSRAQLKKLRRMQAPYIKWTSAVATGSATALLTTSGSGSSTSTSSSVTGSVLDGSSGDLESLLMPEFEPSMAAFVRWKLRPLFKVPQPPRAPSKGSTAAAAATAAGAAGAAAAHAAAAAAPAAAAGGMKRHRGLTRQRWRPEQQQQQQAAQ